MKLLYIILIGFCFAGCLKEDDFANSTFEGGALNHIGIVRTAYADDWDNWFIELQGVSGTVRTVYTEDWDSWRFNFDGV
ncbi:MAG: hypothetical protein MK212_22580, partial [Saprospiraceae bacterium]|nr:hypothetical protein [Saprospiraceae bacterium]